MKRPDYLTRRHVLAAGTAGAAAVLAGCLDGDDDDVDDALGPDDFEGVDEFVFDGTQQAWIGVEPDVIAGVNNPTIWLFEGETYDFEWVNADGILHNLQIEDAGGNVIDDYVSDDVETEGESARIEGVTATSDMAQYICDYHRTTQVADIEVE